MTRIRTEVYDNPFVIVRYLRQDWERSTAWDHLQAHPVLGVNYEDNVQTGRCNPWAKRHCGRYWSWEARTK